MDRQQDEGERSAKIAMVLSNVPKAMSRRKWFQMPHNVRVAPATIAPLRGQFAQVHERVFQGIRRRLLGLAETAVWDEEGACQ